MHSICRVFAYMCDAVFTGASRPLSEFSLSQLLYGMAMRLRLIHGGELDRRDVTDILMPTLGGTFPGLETDESPSSAEQFQMLTDNFEGEDRDWMATTWGICKAAVDNVKRLQPDLFGFLARCESFEELNDGLSNERDVRDGTQSTLAWFAASVVQLPFKPTSLPSLVPPVTDNMCDIILHVTGQRVDKSTLARLYEPCFLGDTAFALDLIADEWHCGIDNGYCRGELTNDIPCPFITDCALYRRCV
ncbi:MAG: hypothetical protein FDZ75_00445 [Actinobacteria bacterium]|nr:MAG: hypothetical protein FDZ75_00445 [Actinomycetota bacterium]